jgi:hypothetical protein
MAPLTDTIPRLKRALSDARASDVARIDEGLLRFGLTGVHGEPEVGTTSVVETALRRSAQPSIRVDLDGTTSEADVAWLIARGIARLHMGAPALSLLAAPAIAPTSARRSFVQFREQVGGRLADFAVAEQPTEVVSVPEALDSIAKLWGQAANPPVLWIDHLQAPALVVRHPVDVDALLWNIRSLQQKTELPIVLSGNTAVTELAYGNSRAFYGDGVWVTLDRPRIDAWLRVAGQLGEDAPSREWTREMADITSCHPGTMLLAFGLRSQFPERAHSPLDLWHLMLSLDDGHVARAIQHSRSLHRLGGYVLERLAYGIGPYERAQTKAERNERGRAARRLHEAGLITRTRPRTWVVTNPLLGGRLRRDMPLTAADAHPLEAAEQDEALA